MRVLHRQVIVQQHWKEQENTQERRHESALQDWEPPDDQDSPRTVLLVPTTTEVFTRANTIRACVATKALCFNVRENAYHTHASVNNGVMPFRPASRVCIPLGERGLKAVCLYIGLIHQVDAILIAQLIPAGPCVIQAPLFLF